MEQTGEGDELAVAEEILRTELRELRIVVALGLGGDVEIGNEEGLGQIAVAVGKFLGRVARRNGHEFVVPRAVGGEAAHFEALVALFELTVAQNVRAGGAGIGLVVLQSAEILVLEEDVLKASVEEQAVVARTEGAGGEIGRGEEYVRGGIARSSDVGGNHKGAFLFHHRGVGSVVGFVGAAAGERCGEQGCGKQRFAERDELHKENENSLWMREVCKGGFIARG